MTSIIRLLRNVVGRATLIECRLYILQDTSRVPLQPASCLFRKSGTAPRRSIRRVRYARPLHPPSANQPLAVPVATGLPRRRCVRLKTTSSVLFCFFLSTVPSSLYIAVLPLLPSFFLPFSPLLPSLARSRGRPLLTVSLRRRLKKRAVRTRSLNSASSTANRAVYRSIVLRLECVLRTDFEALVSRPISMLGLLG